MGTDGQQAAWDSMTTLSWPVIHEHWRSTCLKKYDSETSYVAYNLRKDSWIQNAVTTSESIGAQTVLSWTETD